MRQTSLISNFSTSFNILFRSNTRLVRDEWESKQKKLESRLSALLGTEWHVSIDAEYLYPMAEERYAKESPGAMFRELVVFRIIASWQRRIMLTSLRYIEAAISRIQDFVDKYGNDGKGELNKTAAGHIVTIAPTNDPNIEYTGCDISDGQLRLLFSRGNLGVNIDRPAEDVASAINDAEVAMDSGDTATVGFHARSSIKADYEANIAQLQEEIQKTLALPVLELVPNFETNFAKLAAYRPENYDFPRDWQQQYGRHCLRYFEGFASNVKELGFATDDLLQEGFGEAVERNEISLRVVDRLVKGEYNECFIENGILYIQTTPRDWMANVADIGRDLIDLL